MKSALIRQLCRALIVCLGMLPFGGYAAMIGTDQLVMAQNAGAGGRAQVRSFVARAEMRDQLQSLGISPAAAQARVDAMTEAEVASVAGKIDRLPAGGIVSYWAVAASLLIVELIIYYWVE